MGLARRDLGQGVDHRRAALGRQLGPHQRLHRPAQLGAVAAEQVEHLGPGARGMAAQHHGGAGDRRQADAGRAVLRGGQHDRMAGRQVGTRADARTAVPGQRAEPGRQLPGGLQRRAVRPVRGHQRHLGLARVAAVEEGRGQHRQVVGQRQRLHGQLQARMAVDADPRELRAVALRRCGELHRQLVAVGQQLRVELQPGRELAAAVQPGGWRHRDPPDRLAVELDHQQIVASEQIGRGRQHQRQGRAAHQLVGAQLEMQPLAELTATDLVRMVHLPDLAERQRQLAAFGAAAHVELQGAGGLRRRKGRRDGIRLRSGGPGGLDALRCAPGLAGPGRRQQAQRRRRQRGLQVQGTPHHADADEAGGAAPPLRRRKTCAQPRRPSRHTSASA